VGYPAEKKCVSTTRVVPVLTPTKDLDSVFRQMISTGRNFEMAEHTDTATFAQSSVVGVLDLVYENPDWKFMYM
jgi:hypothetical protein